VWRPAWHRHGLPLCLCIALSVWLWVSLWAMDKKLRELNKKLARQRRREAGAGGGGGGGARSAGDVIVTNVDDGAYRPPPPPPDPAALARQRADQQAKERCVAAWYPALAAPTYRLTRPLSRRAQQKEATQRAREILATTPEIKGGIVTRCGGGTIATPPPRPRRCTAY
jgi:hypothetical protein